MRLKKKTISRRQNDEGVVITLVAMFMLFIVGAMAALSIDVVTFYTARSEAQLAADSGALAAARVLANSGMTSDVTENSIPTAETLATTVAMQVASSNYVGGRTLVPGGACPGAEICVSFPNQGDALAFDTNPHVTVQVQRTDVPTFFGRIWGSKQVTVTASATAEAYNPSGANVATGTVIPVAPMCVKPWLLPNIDPSNLVPNLPIFNTTNGNIATTTLLGYQASTAAARMRPRCTNCGAPGVPIQWRYYPGKPSNFPAPTTALPACTPALTTAYEKSIAGCVQTPIACNAQVEIDNTNYPTRDTETADGVNCLTHATAAADDADQVDVSGGVNPPYQFLAGAANPVAVANPALLEQDMTVSDSLVTVPVYDVGSGTTPPPVPPGTVTIIGFVQLFLNYDGAETPNVGGPASLNGRVKTMVINLAGCGGSGGATAAQPILGNGASPVAVRLITPP
ncbi:MAG: pilus assembly protein TadG-related protein [Terriglobales bacterium]